MEKHLELLRITRANFLKKVEGLSIEQLNVIPTGLNNSIAWNLGHVIVTQQLLCYKLSGVACKVSDAMIDKYRKGTKPTASIDAEEIEQLKVLMFETIDWLKADLADGIFTNYKTYPTSFGVTLTSIEDGIVFNNMHEAMHYGNVIVMEKLV